MKFYKEYARDIFTTCSYTPYERWLETKLEESKYKLDKLEDAMQVKDLKIDRLYYRIINLECILKRLRSK